MDIHFRDVGNYQNLQDFIKKGKEEGKKIFIEIGFGSGIVLRKRVLEYPDCLHIGIEIKGKYVKRLNQFIDKYSIDNLLVEKCDIKYILPRFVEPDSFDKIFIYYPDPWWKKRQKKYILFDYYFMADLYRSLKKGGTLNIKTDVKEYYEKIESVFDNFKHFKLSKFDDPTVENNKSTFEIKGIEQGRSLHQIAFTK